MPLKHHGVEAGASGRPHTARDLTMDKEGIKRETARQNMWSECAKIVGALSPASLCDLSARLLASFNERTEQRMPLHLCFLVDRLLLISLFGVFVPNNNRKKKVPPDKLPTSPPSAFAHVMATVAPRYL